VRVLLSAIGFVIAATAAAAGAGAKPEDTVRQKFAAFNKHDIDAIEQIYAKDATLRSPDYPSLAGNGPIADTYRKILEAIPDAKDNVEIIESSPNHVYAQFVLTGHYRGAQDKPVNVRL